MPTRPVVDHGRCEAKRDCVRVCPYDVFEVRRMDPDDFTALGMLGKLRSTAHRRMTAYVARARSMPRMRPVRLGLPGARHHLGAAARALVS